MKGKKVNAEEIKGACAHTVTIGEVTFPDGQTLQSVLLAVDTPVGLIALHFSPSNAAKLAADLAATALEIVKAKQTREMEEQAQTLIALRRMMDGDTEGITLGELLRMFAGDAPPAPGDKSKH